jgi:hypothetical protein
MKNCKLLFGLFFFTISIFSVCFANPPISKKWYEDGRIVSSTGKKVQLDLQNVYDGLEYRNKTYIVGFKINSDGINTPQIAEVSEDLKEIQYWTFDSIINDVFVYKRSIYANNIAGKVFELTGDSWKEANLSFPENSQVVFSDGMEQLVVCHSASLPMTASHKGGCYSISPNWRYDFTWFDLAPKVCGNKLYIYENKVSGGVFRVLSLESGQVLYSKLLSTPPGNICDVEQK